MTPSALQLCRFRNQIPLALVRLRQSPHFPGHFNELRRKDIMLTRTRYSVLVDIRLLMPKMVDVKGKGGSAFNMGLVFTVGWSDRLARACICKRDFLNCQSCDVTQSRCARKAASINTSYRTSYWIDNRSLTPVIWHAQSIIYSIGLTASMDE